MKKVFGKVFFAAALLACSPSLYAQTTLELSPKLDIRQALPNIQIPETNGKILTPIAPLCLEPKLESEEKTTLADALQTQKAVEEEKTVKSVATDSEEESSLFAGVFTCPEKVEVEVDGDQRIISLSEIKSRFEGRIRVAVAETEDKVKEPVAVPQEPERPSQVLSAPEQPEVNPGEVVNVRPALEFRSGAGCSLQLASSTSIVQSLGMLFALALPLLNAIRRRIR